MELQKIFSTHISEVRKYYNVTENDVQNYVNILQEWIRGQPHLPQLLIEDTKILERMLLRNKFRIAKTKEQIESYCTLRGKYKFLLDYYTCIKPSTEPCFALPMPKLTPKLQRVIVGQLLNENDYDFERATAFVILMMEISLVCDYSIENVVILDFINTTTKYLTKLNLRVFRIFFILLKKAYSGRVGGIHLINCPQFVNILIKIIKPFIPDKIMDRLHIHDTLETLYQFIPKEILPEDYGGEEKSAKELLDEYDTIFKKNQDFFKKSLQYISTKYSQFDEFAGTFRSLDFD